MISVMSNDAISETQYVIYDKVLVYELKSIIVSVFINLAQLHFSYPTVTSPLVLTAELIKTSWPTATLKKK